METDGYINGYVRRTTEGFYEGEIRIEGINLSPITGLMFRKDGKVYLWLRRKDMLEYDPDEQRYVSRKREPRWEAYLEKQMDGNTVMFRGTFPFMRFRFEITGVWDGVLGMNENRLNFYIDRLPMDRQDIIRSINERRKGNEHGEDKG